MQRASDYLSGDDLSVGAIVTAIDRDVERGEDLLMLGLGVVMMSSFFAPIAPPKILLPLVALAFALSAGFALQNFHNMQRKLTNSFAKLEAPHRSALRPIAEVFNAQPLTPLTESFNPLKNLKRTWKSALGGILINPFWMPIFYMMGIQIDGEKRLVQLNRAVFAVRKSISPPPEAPE